ncbi:Na(+)/H(+) antiporter subunit E [Andreesenia angusta]|uniref:Na(+)/H(+) antiporter subunit E n=1 Tax=Andreesenia angusta TaxID=39480 RepID=A0A1S1V6G9_9FIRM|nr:Na+/H+ antiporter subunit E [Andreesenia angusta]OHW61717.1 Na(+)/H(+) antiporter subunit E [Andreesenia angusta]
MKSYIGIFTLLYAFWIILSERVEVESLTVGAVVCVGVLLYNSKIIERKRKSSFKKVWLLFRFVGVLLKEIVISNFQVAAIVLGRKLEIDPQVFEYRTVLKTDKYRTVLANAITLTPGTITLAIDGDNLTIHGLRKENIDGVVDSEIEKILIQIEGA